jgi:hypothetical protein
LATNNIGAIDYLLSTTNFDFIVDKIKIDYYHWELFMRVWKNNSDILYIPTVRQGCNI